MSTFHGPIAKRFCMARGRYLFSVLNRYQENRVITLAIQFTDQQQKILDARDHNILVSAAAGSGKTAVLVERIVRMISEGEHPLDIDRLLIVTFTRAAAAQMRERIGRAISQRLALDPGNRHLQRQEVLLQRAQISTIDSFCTFLLKNGCGEIDLDPGFRQMDETEAKLLAGDTVKRYLEEQYEKAERDFLACAEYFCPGRNDAALENLILQLHEAADSHPYPEVWLHERRQDYAVPDEETLLGCSWYQDLILEKLDAARELKRRYDSMLAIVREPDGPYPWLDLFTSEGEQLFGWLRALPFEKKSDPAPEAADSSAFYDPKGARGEMTGAADAAESGKLSAAVLLRIRGELIRMAEFSFANLNKFPISKKDKEYIDPDKRKSATALRDKLKKLFKKLGDGIEEEPQETLRRMRAAEGPVNTLIDLTLGFRRAFQQAKKQKNALDFSDLEHDALQILIDRADDGTLTLKKTALSYRAYYAEVLIDEYQDSNEVQELLLCALTGEPGADFAKENAGERDAGLLKDGSAGAPAGRYARFMVGDVKQSIYGFRNARPQIFQEKFDTYTVCGRDSGTHPEAKSAKANSLMGSGNSCGSGSCEMKSYRPENPLTERIDLDQNFRSRRQVLDAVNGICGKVMRREVGGVEYDDVVSLKQGASYPEPEPGPVGEDPYETELLVVDCLVPDQEKNQKGGTEGGRTQRDSEAGSAGGDPDEEIAALANNRKEALAVAQRIHRLVGTLPVTDEKTGQQRPARYGDIVILLRSTAGKQDDFREIFEKEGIPLYLEYKGGYFSAEEIREVLQMLRIIDNPRQDIPLYGAMRGYFGGFSQDEIGAVRSLLPRERDVLLYDCLLAAAGKTEENPAAAGVPEGDGEKKALFGASAAEGEKEDLFGASAADKMLNVASAADGSSDGISSAAGEKAEKSGETAEISAALREKCRSFLALLDDFRALSRTSPIHELIGELIRSTGYEDYVRALPAGQKRAANLTSLLVKARAFEQTDYAGLFRFLRYIDQMGEFDVDYGEASALDERADVVRLTTIHKSKGLEYPICFVCGLGSRATYTRDLSGMLLTNADLGLGVQYVDADLRCAVPTLRQKAVSARIARESAGEELRVLYVAMTRAKEKLILTGAFSNAEKKLCEIESEVAALPGTVQHLPASMILSRDGFLALILRATEALKAEGKEPVRVVRVPVSDLELAHVEDQMVLGTLQGALDAAAAKEPGALPDPSLARQLEERFSFRYPHEELAGLYTKTTVTELKRAALLGSGDGEESTAAPRELYPEEEYIDYSVPYEAAEESVQQVCAQPRIPGEESFGTTLQGGAGKDRERSNHSLGAAAEAKQERLVGSGQTISSNIAAEAHAAANAAKAVGGAGAGRPELPVPRFAAEVSEAGEGSALRGASRGTAVHRLCELIDFHRWPEPGKVTARQWQEWVSSLLAAGTIPRAYADIARPGTFLPFLHTGVAARMAAADAAGLLGREQPFVLGVPAGRLDGVFPPEETILIQGIIDAFFIEEGAAHARHIVLVDYKTDRVKTPEELIARYRVQLDYYAQALEKMLRLPVSERILYSFALNREIHVD